MATKRVSHMDPSTTTSSTTTQPSAHATTAASSLNLLPASIRPPPTHSLQHATLATLAAYQTHTLTPTAFSTPTAPSYRPRATSPLPPSAFNYAGGEEVGGPRGGGGGGGERLLLDELLAGNRAREAADRRLRLDVADRVSRWSHDVALQGERAVQQMDAMHNQRSNNGTHQQQNSKSAGEEEKENLTLGYTIAPDASKAAWTRKQTPTPTEPTKKLSKKDKEKEELDTRMRNLSLAHSPLSLPPTTSYLEALLPPPSCYVGSALGVSLSAFRSGEPLAVSEVAREMVSSAAVAAVLAGQAAAAGGGGAVPSSAASLGGVSDGGVVASGAVAGSPFPTASALHAEVNRVKACVTAAGMYVHAGAVERALGGGRAVAGAAVSGSGGAWPVPFSGLVDDPKDKKKRAGADKKTAVKKAVKKK